MSNNAITISHEEYSKLCAYKMAVEENGSVVFERRTTTENGERHEDMLIYTQKEYQEKIETMYQLQFETNPVPPHSEQEYQLVLLQNNRLARETIRKERDFNVLNGRYYGCLDTISQKNRKIEALENSIEKLEEAIFCTWLFVVAPLATVVLMWLFSLI